MPRETCPCCNYPLSACLCDAIAPVYSRHRVTILQHPSEAVVAKNTARLVKLCLGDRCDLQIAERITLNAPEPAFLLYPDKDATPVEQLSLPKAANLIFLDGTWRKAFKLLKLNPELEGLPKLSFSQLPPSRYVIRKAHRDDSLSTLEAVAYSLAQLDAACDVQPLYHSLEALKQQQLSRMPPSVRARYAC